MGKKKLTTEIKIKRPMWELWHLNIRISRRAGIPHHPTRGGNPRDRRGPSSPFDHAPAKIPVCRPSRPAPETDRPVARRERPRPPGGPAPAGPTIDDATWGIASDARTVFPPGPGPSGV